MLLFCTSRRALWLLCFLFKFRCSFGKTQKRDVILGGIFSEHFPRSMSRGKVPVGDRDNNPCGDPNRGATADRLAMEFAVSEINHRDDILPEIWLGVNMKDSCSDLDYAINNTLDYEFIKTRFVNESFQCAPEDAGSKCCLDRQKGDSDAPLVAIIAGAYSHIVKAIVNLVGLFKVPVVGYSSTSPSLNKMDYFLRTVAPDTVSTKVMVDLIQELNWNIVLVIYVDNEFGHYAADCFRTAVRAKKNICIAFDGKFSKTSRQEEIQRVIKDMKKIKKSQVVAFFGTTEDFVYFQERTGPDFDPNGYIWISSELWLRSDLLQMPVTITDILTIIPDQHYPRARLFEYLRRNAEVNTTCSDREDSIAGRNCTYEQSKYIPLVLDAVYAVAVALHNMLGCEAEQSCRGKLNTIHQRSLLDYLKNVSFTNTDTKQNISFDSNGNPRSASFTVLKLKIGNGIYANTSVACWRNGSVVSKVGGSNLTSVINSTRFGSNCGPACNPGEHKSVEEDFPDCCWTCRKCTENKYANTSGQLACSECADDRWPNSNHTACAEIEHDHLNVASPPGILLLAWNCAGVAIILLVAGVFLKYSSSHIVRASSRQLSFLLLLGITMDFSLLMVLLREPNRLQCCAIFVLTHVSNCLVAGTLFLKTNRIHRIFRKSAMTERPRCLGNACQVSIVFILVSIEIILATIVLVYEPKNGDVRVTYVMEGDSKKAFLLCNFFGRSFQNDVFHVLIWSYDCGMIFICTYQAYLVRKVPENYNEARYITFTMVTISMNMLVYVITNSGMVGKNLVLVYCIFQSLKTSVALGCMFLPKVYVILFQPEKNVPHNPVKSQLGTFVEDNAALRAKPADSVSSGSSTQHSESEAVTGGSASATACGRPYRKVGVQIERTVAEEPGDKFEELRVCDVSPYATEGYEEKRSAGIVLVNGLAAGPTVSNA